jgi:predicted RNase H-like nuclease (RuvC/YqgF family)
MFDLCRWSGRVKKLENDLERQQAETAQLLDKNEQTTREVRTSQSHSLSLRERNSELESELNRMKVDSRPHDVLIRAPISRRSDRTLSTARHVSTTRQRSKTDGLAPRMSIDICRSVSSISGESTGSRQ